MTTSALERGRALTQQLNPKLEAVLSDRYDDLLPEFSESLVEWAYTKRIYR